MSFAVIFVLADRTSQMDSSKLQTEEEIFDRLQAKLLDADQNSPTLATGQFALERRSSSRRGSPLYRTDQQTRLSGLSARITSPTLSERTRSPALSDHGAPTRIKSPSPHTLDTGLRSTASSPGPSRTDTNVRKAVPPPLALQPKQMRPASELFLPTPADPNKRMTVFKLPAVVLEEPTFAEDLTTSLNEMFLPTPPDIGRKMPLIDVPKTIAEDGDNVEDEGLEPMSPGEPPMSPMSSAIAKARFSRLDVHNSVRHMVNNLNIITEHPASLHARAVSTPVIERAATVPPTLQRTLSSVTVKTFRSVPTRNRSFRSGGGRSRATGVRPITEMFKKRGVRYSGIDKDIIAAKRLTALNIKQKTEIGPAAAARSPDTPGALPNIKPANSVLPWRRKKRGETMSMLLDAGFFPVNEYIYNEKQRPGRHPSKKGKALSILVSDLPSSPLSIVGTPTEFYHRGLPNSPRRHIRGNTRRSFAPRRRHITQLNGPTSPTTPRTAIIANALALSPLSPPKSPSFSMSPLTPSKSLFALTGAPASPVSPPERSPGILEVIHEDTDGADNPQSSTPVIEEDSLLLTEEPEDIEPDAPVKTEIHLNSGTVLTVCPPELTAWTKNTYIQGPIQLPTPILAPRKDSVASLAPFQTAVDQIYDQALQVPRRGSEDQTVDDLLEWYDTWNFGVPSFAFDDFKENVYPLDADSDGEYSTPTPVDKAVAAQMLGLPHRPPASFNTPGFGSSSIGGSNTTVIKHLSTRKPSLAGSSRRQSISALSTLPENESVSPTTSSFPTFRKDSVTQSTSPLPPAKDSHLHTNGKVLSQDDMWADEDSDPDTTTSKSLWGHTHLEVREIRGSRRTSSSTITSNTAVTGVRDSSNWARRDTNASLVSIADSERRRRERERAKKKSMAAGKKVRRFVATASSII